MSYRQAPMIKCHDIAVKHANLALDNNHSLFPGYEVGWHWWKVLIVPNVTLQTSTQEDKCYP